MKKQIRSVFSALGRAGTSRGKYAEKRAVEVINKHIVEGQLSWAKSARKATSAEDRRGIDVVVDTERGPLYLQIKSSVAGAKGVVDYLTKKGIGLVVVTTNKSDSTVLRECLIELDKLRDRFNMNL